MEKLIILNKDLNVIFVIELLFGKINTTKNIMKKYGLNFGYTTVIQ